MSKPIQPPSIFSPMNYTKAAVVMAVVLVLLGGFSTNYGLVGIGGLLLMMSGIMRDVQRNYVGLVLLTKSIGQDADIFKEHERKIEALSRGLAEATNVMLELRKGLQNAFEHNNLNSEAIVDLQSLKSRIEDLYRQHNPMVGAIESLQGDLAEFRREYRKQVDLLKAEDHVLQLEIDKVKNPPYFAGDL